jgi:NIPSNAP
MGWSPIVELRQYTLRPGKRDALIELFDSSFVESQEATGMKVIGQFRDLDDPNKFVWLRGFPTMPQRAQSLADFYGGPIWQNNREAANATMLDSDDVLLLRPARVGSEFTLDRERPPPRADDGVDRGLVEATILHLDAPANEEILGFFDTEIAPGLAAAGATTLACFVTEESKNSFPALPVREGEHVFVWFAGFADRVAHERLTATARNAGRAPGLKRAAEVLRLAPTSRSHLT